MFNWQYSVLSFYIIFTIYYGLLCVCIPPPCLYKGQRTPGRSLRESLFSFHHVGPKNGAQSGLGARSSTPGTLSPLQQSAFSDTGVKHNSLTIYCTYKTHRKYVKYDSQILYLIWFLSLWFIPSERKCKWKSHMRFQDSLVPLAGLRVWTQHFSLSRQKTLPLAYLPIFRSPGSSWRGCLFSYSSYTIFSPSFFPATFFLPDVNKVFQGNRRRLSHNQYVVFQNFFN